MRPRRVCLVGSQQQENLGLEYLAAAVEQAGHEPHLLCFESRHDVDAVVRRVVDLEADLVGLSIAFQHGVRDYQLLIETLRQRGYRGHLTCGGHVPTFCHAELLRDQPGLDTVIRFEGEEALCELVARLAADEPLDGIPGLVWRTAGAIAQGPPRPLCDAIDELPLPKRREQPFYVGGLPLAFVITARGCSGECSYCCLRAFAREAGGARLRLRDPDAVGAELAALRRDRGVRVVVVQDDLFILPSARHSIERMAALREALTSRGVDDVVFWVKGRPETISREVAVAAREMGAIHLFLGVESAAAERLRYLGRHHDPSDNRRAIARCREAGLMPSFNLMLFDPDCTMADIATTIDFAADHVDLPWNVCRTEIYSGTELRARLAAEGRLRGDYRGYGYRIADPRAELLFRILRVCFHDRAFACDSLLNRVISLSFAKQIHQHFFPGPAADRLAAEVEAVLDTIYRDTVERLRRAFDFAQTVEFRASERVHQYAAEVGLAIHRKDAVWSAQVADLWTRLHARGVAHAVAEQRTG